MIAYRYSYISLKYTIFKDFSMIFNKNRQNFIAGVLFVSIASIPNELCSFEAYPYIGFDHQLNRMKFKEGYGHNMFPKHFKQLNLYGGFKFNNQNALELGYVSTLSKNKYSILYAGDKALGATISHSASPAKFISYIKVKGYHLGMTNIYFPSISDSFRILGGVGLSFLTAEAERNCIALGCPPAPGTIRKFKKRRTVLRLMAASEYKFKNDLGLRLSFCFIQTSKMVIRAYPRDNAFTPIIKPKDSFIYGLGIFYEF
jgi:hypothetical protein